SRRRHTISKRDWSSDVCSSDLKHLPSFEMQIQQNGEMLLGPEADERAAAHELGRSEKLELKLSDHLHSQPHLNGFRHNVLRPCRSEERRVGKESRVYW